MNEGSFSISPALPPYTVKLEPLFFTPEICAGGEDVICFMDHPVFPPQVPRETRSRHAVIISVRDDDGTMGGNQVALSLP